MSLDVTLYLKKHVSYDNCKTWSEEREDVYSDNITHNLNTMAMDADLYYYVWRPDENLIIEDKYFIWIMKGGLNKLKAKPEHYKKFNPENGWGSYEGLVKFIEKYLEACEKYPNAFVEVSR